LEFAMIAGSRSRRRLAVFSFVLLAAVSAALAQQRIVAKSGAAMCGALTAADFSSVNVRTDAKPTANVSDGGASAYCVFAGKSGATGGVELDVFYPAGTTPADVKETMNTASAETTPALAPITVPGADEARWSASTKSGGPAFATIVVRRGNLVLGLSIPTGKDAQAQLMKLVDVALKRL
jgi:hypothetical protein